MAGIISDPPGNPNHTGRESGKWVLLVLLAPVIFFTSVFAYGSAISDHPPILQTKTVLPTNSKPTSFVTATHTPLPKPTEAVTPDAVSSPTKVETPIVKSTPEILKAHLSFYWPPLGDINCDYECEHLANGDIWQKWNGTGIACPEEYSLGTEFIIMGDEWKCVDRGDAIVTNPDGTIWLDMLTPYMPYGLGWGAVKQVEVIRIP